LQAQQFIIKSYDYNNGLISGANHFTMQDSVGFYWTCSYGGLVKFDGSTFRSFKNAEGIVHYDVNHMYEIKKDNFIVCNQFSLLRFDGNLFTEFKLPEGRKYKFVNTISLNGMIVCNTDKKVLQITPENKLIPFLVNQKDIRRAFKVADKSYIITNANQFCLLDKNIVTPLVNLQRYMDVVEVALIQNELYLTTNNGVFKLQEGKLVLLFLHQLEVNSIYEDKKNRIWFTDKQHQVWLQSGDVFQNLTQKYHTKEVIEPWYMEDKNHNLVITSLYGITIYKENFCEEVSIEEINNTEQNYVARIYGKDTICVGIKQEGFVAITQGRKIIIPVKIEGVKFDGKTYRCDVELTENENEKVVRISSKGLFLFKQGNLKPYSSVAFNFNLLYSGYYDTMTKLYYAGNNMGVLYKVSPNHIDSFAIPSGKGLIINHIQKIPNGSLLLSGTHEKLFLYYNHSLHDITSQLRTPAKTFSAFVHQNKLWLVVHGVELQEYEIRGNSLHYIRSITKQDGLEDANIAAISFDNDQNLWLNTFSGIYFLKHTEGSGIYCKRIYLQQGSTNAPMINSIVHSSDKIVVTGIGSAMILDAKSILNEIPSYKAYFSTIKLNNIDLSQLVKDKKVNLVDGVYKIPIQYNSILFQCNAVYFGFDDAIQFQYRLNDEPWRNLVSTNAIQYNDMSNGTYTLQLRAVNKLNTASFTESKFIFLIQPPYWKTWWFRGILMLLSVACIYGFIKRRDAIKEKENKIRLQMSELKLTALQSQMNPHFIFNSMNSIQNYIMQQKPIEAARYLSKFSLLMRRILDQSFDNVAPLSEIVATLNMYLELESYRFNHGFEWHIDINENVQTEKIKLPAMLLQPFVENAIIHGLMPKQGDKKLLILFEEKNNCLYCVIDDNGVGVKENLLKDKTHVSRGQKLVYDMLETMKEVLQTKPIIETIHKKADNGHSLGTTISIAIPINRTKL
jgi:hypothetical protein